MRIHKLRKRDILFPLLRALRLTREYAYNYSNDILISDPPLSLRIVGPHDMTWRMCVLWGGRLEEGEKN